RLDQITALREQVKTLLPRLEPGSMPPAGGDQREAVTGHEAPQLDVEVGNPEFLGATFRRLVATLEDSSPDDDPKQVTLSPQVFSLRVEPREVVAYRRIFGLEPTGVREVEQFLL